MLRSLIILSIIALLTGLLWLTLTAYDPPPIEPLTAESVEPQKTRNPARKWKLHRMTFPGFSV